MKYRVRISDKGTNTNVGYYAASKAWQSVVKDQADVLTHKRARYVVGKMKRLGYYASIEVVSG